jgi:hypothetical protein
MSDQDQQIGNLFTAELQFRLASAVRLAVNLGNQPLDLPTEWTHGRHRVKYEEIALRPDQADFAAASMHHSATLMMAIAMRDAIATTIPDPKNHGDPDISSAYQIARLFRNAFAHRPFNPVWLIDSDCQSKTFAVRDIVALDTTALHGVALDWRHYGGPLALLRLCQFVRFEILKDTKWPRKNVPPPSNVINQIGDLILKKVDEIPPDAIPVELETDSDGKVHLGDGYFLGRAAGDPREA